MHLRFLQHQTMTDEMGVWQAEKWPPQYVHDLSLVTCEGYHVWQKRGALQVLR